MRQCTICGSQAERHMCGGTPTLPPYDGLSEEIRNLRAGLESLQRSHMQDMEMAIEQRDKAYSELDAMKLQVSELQKKLDRVIEITQERVDKFTDTWNVTHGVGADGRLDAATKLLAQFRALIEKPKCEYCEMGWRFWPNSTIHQSPSPNVASQECRLKRVEQSQKCNHGELKVIHQCADCGDVIEFV